MANEDARQVFQNFLDNLGLGHMVDLINEAVVNSWDPSVFTAKVEADARFKQAFPEIDAARKAGIEMNAGQVLEYRTGVKQIMSEAGMPKDFYDSADDFPNLIGKGISLTELSSRMEKGFMKVAQAPQEVKDAFNSFFGAQGESALASFFLDPNRSISALTQMAEQSEISGTGRRFGFDINLDFSERLREIAGVERAAQGIEQAFNVRELATETIEETTDLTSQDLLEGTLGENTEDRERMEQRLMQRRADFAGGGGGAQTQRGFGTGAAR